MSDKTMGMSIEELIKSVGMQYEQYDEDGQALGCFLPIYMMYPNTKKYDWPEQKEFKDKVLVALNENGHHIPEEEILPGDVVAFTMPFGFLHVGIYLGNDKIIHCMTDDNMEICRLSLIARRIEGVYKWDS